MESMKNNLFSFLILIFAVACHSNQESPTNLKNLALARGVTIGTLYNSGYSAPPFSDFDIYNQTIVREFTTISLEWEFAMDEIWLAENSMDYSYLDKALQFATDNGLQVRGTHLIWHATIPPWLENGSYTNEQVSTLVQGYIAGLMAHITTNFPGILSAINMVNEVIRDDADPDTTYGNLRNTFWVRKLGATFITDIANWTKAAMGSESIPLYLNEYGVELAGDKLLRFLSLLDDLQSSSVPLDGVGLQAHFSIHDLIDDPFQGTVFQSVLEEYASRGLYIEITELDVRINDDQSGKSDDKLIRQSDLYQEVVAAALNNPLVKGIHLWGFQDDLSYLNGSADWLPQSRDWGLIFDENFQPKPAYYGLARALQEQSRLTMATCTSL